MSKLRVLDLFSGIGGFSLGLERTGGFETVAFCEIEPFPRRVLAKHWPNVPIYEDVRDLTAERLSADGIGVDVICGGFPCQDISSAGAKAGITGARSGLWFEYARLIGELRPAYVIVENVGALLARGLDAVLGELAALGYDAEWHCVPASAIGAPHQRDRLWLVGYPNDQGQSAFAVHDETSRLPGLVADASSQQDSGIQFPRLAPDLGASHWWAAEPEVDRVAYGVPFGVDRLRALGNAVVPQIPEMIGRAILAAEARPMLEAAE
jgi:DNA (cytosine-5)-methyltransferase 1